MFGAAEVLMIFLALSMALNLYLIERLRQR